MVGIPKAGRKVLAPLAVDFSARLSPDAGRSKPCSKKYARIWELMKWWLD
jgi:hypothetical protein